MKLDWNMHDRRQFVSLGASLALAAFATSTLVVLLARVEASPAPAPSPRSSDGGRYAFEPTWTAEQIDDLSRLCEMGAGVPEPSPAVFRCWIEDPRGLGRAVYWEKWAMDQGKAL